MNELEADAICFANLKGQKDKELLKTAEALRFKKRLPGFGSNSSVGRYFGVSGEIVREFLALLVLPEHIRPLIEEGKIGLDIGARLARVKRENPDILDDLAKAVTDLPALDARDVIEYTLKNPEVSASEAKQRVLDAKTIVVDEFHVMVVFSKEEFTRLETEAKCRRVSAGQLVASVTNEWLRGVDGHATR